MQIMLRITSGQYAGRTIHLREGQTAQIGRTDWADFSLPEEQGLADVHFAVRCAAEGCVVRNLDEKFETHLNGEPIAEQAVRSGDEIKTGGITWQLSIEGETVEQVARAEDPNPAESEAEEQEDPPSGMELATYLEMYEESLELATDEQTPDELLAALREAEQHGDAVMLQAYLFPPREAVWWACLCVRDICGAEFHGADAQAFAAAERWVTEPNEIYRRGAESAFKAAGTGSVAGVLSQAAFVSEGSLSPPGYEEVEPDDRLTASLIRGALLMSAYGGDAALAEGRLDAFFQKAKDLEENKIALPKP